MISTPKIRDIGPTLVLLALSFLGSSAVQAQFGCLSLGTGAGNPGVSTGNRNTALGEFSLASNTTGSDNSSVGAFACNANTTGNSNTALGSFALVSNTIGDVNTAIGSGTMPSNTSGNANTAVGVSALNSNTTGASNTALGFQALFSNTTALNNTAVGAGALGLGRGTGNIGLGFQAGRNVTNGSNNIHIGNIAPGNESNTIRIGTSQTATFLAGVDGVTVSGGTQVFIDSNGQLGTLTSSVRFKEDVEDMGQASQALMKLRPVTFHYKAGVDDGTHLLQYGLIAEEVAKVYPELVQYNDKGQAVTVRYHLINAMLLNELQKQHEREAELQAQVAEQKAKLEQQEARLKRLEALLAN